MLSTANKLKKDVSREHELVKRFNYAIGRLNSAKTQKDKHTMMLELHSIIRLLESTQKELVLDILRDLKVHLQQIKDKKAIIKLNEAIRLLEKKFVTV